MSGFLRSQPGPAFRDPRQRRRTGPVKGDYAVVRRRDAYRWLGTGEKQNGLRDFRRDLAAAWAVAGRRLTGGQWRKARRADRRTEKGAA